MNASSQGLPYAVYDEQIGTTFTQVFTSIAYNVTAVAQSDSYGYGPAYLLNGLTPAGYWYQVGLSYNWPYSTSYGGGYKSGFYMIYAVFDNHGNVVSPPGGGGGLLSYSRGVNQGDNVLLSLSFSGGNVVIYSYDWNAGGSASTTYSAEGSSTFSGSGGGFFTGLMTEWWHANPYYGGEQEVLYSDKAFALSSAYLWIDEWEPSNPSWSGGFNNCLNSCTTPQSFLSNPNRLYSFSSNGATEYESAHQFITGTLSTASTTISLIPVGSSAPISSSNEFTVTYRFQGANMTAYDGGQPLTVMADLGTYVWFSAMTSASSSLEKWVFDSQSPSVGILAGSSSTLYYYDLISQQAAYSVVDGGSPSPPAVGYYTAPAYLPNQPTYPYMAQTLTQVSQSLWALRGTTISVPGSIPGGQNEQWSLQVSSWTVSMPNQVPSPIAYYHQFRVSFAYSVNGGGSGYSAPTVGYSSYGTGQNANAGVTVWADATTYLFGSLLPGSSSVERWEAGSGTTGSIASSGTYTAAYYHQFGILLTYQVVGGGTAGTPQLTTTYLGQTGSFIMNGASPGAQFAVWADAGSGYQLSQLLSDSTSTERWYGNGASGTANTYSTLSTTYYHQFYVAIDYAVRGGGTPPAPTLLFTSQGTLTSYQMTESPYFTWIDDNHWSVVSTLGGSTAAERWTASSGTNGTANSGSPISPQYFHQFAFTISYSISDNSAAKPPTFASTEFGSQISKTLGEAPTTYWLDNGASWSINGLLSGSSSTERWITKAVTSGTIASAQTLPFTFLHQFYVTIQSGQPAGGTLTPTGWYNASSSIQLTAQAAPGWQFENWNGTGQGSYSGSTNPRSITVESPVMEGATFYPALTITNGGYGQVSYSWGGRQPVSVSGTATFYVPVGTNVSLSASPSPLFVFSKYSGAVNSTKSGSSVVIQAPISVSVSFAPNYPVIGGISAAGILGAAGIYWSRIRRPKLPAKPS